LSENYGTAGLYFVNALSLFPISDLPDAPTLPEIFSLVDLKSKFEQWQDFIKGADGYNIDGKKKMCAALLLLADELVNIIFLGLSVDDAKKRTEEFFVELSRYIEPREDTDVVSRAYEYILAWVAENKSKFARKSVDDVMPPGAKEESMLEVWGKFETSNTLFVSGKILKSVLDEGGFNYELTINEFNRRGWTVKAENQIKSTKTARINGIPVRGIEIRIDV